MQYLASVSIDLQTFHIFYERRELRDLEMYHFSSPWQNYSQINYLEAFWTRFARITLKQIIDNQIHTRHTHIFIVEKIPLLGMQIMFFSRCVLLTIFIHHVKLNSWPLVHSTRHFQVYHVSPKINSKTLLSLNKLTIRVYVLIVSNWLTCWKG